MPTPAPAALVRLDTILLAAEHLLRSLADGAVDGGSAEPPLRLGQLGYRIFRLGLEFIDAVDAGRLPEVGRGESLPEGMRETRALAHYGALVRARVAGWFEGAEAGVLALTVQAQDGSQTAHELLERTTEDAARHLQELYALAGRA